VASKRLPRAAHKPLVSIIVPVLNSEQHLPKMLDSVLAQSLADVEVVCVDNGSTDRSCAIIERYSDSDPRVVFVTEAKRGSAAARNKGLEASTGRYCIFFDSDDYCPNPSALQVLLQAAEESGADVVRGNHMVFTEETGKTSPQRFFDVDMVVRRPGAVTWLEEPVLWIPWTHQVFLIRTRLLHDHRITYPDYLRGQDPPFLLQIFLVAGKVFCLPEVVYVYRNSLERWRNFVWTEASCEDYIRHFAHIRRLLMDRSLEKQWRLYGAWGVYKLRELLPVAMAARNGSIRRLIIETFSDLWTLRHIHTDPFKADIDWDLLFFALFQCHQIEIHRCPSITGMPFLGATSRLVNGRVVGINNIDLIKARELSTRASGPVPFNLRLKVEVAKVLSKLGIFLQVRRAYRSLVRRRASGDL
jgi:glycosyltransferase involved in cell wall biosynthesis